MDQDLFEPRVKTVPGIRAKIFAELLGIDLVSVENQWNVVPAFQHVAGQQGVEIVAMDDTGLDLGGGLVEGEIDQHDRADRGDFAGCGIGARLRTAQFAAQIPATKIIAHRRPPARPGAPPIGAVAGHLRVAASDDFESRSADVAKLCHVLGLVAHRHRNTADFDAIDHVALRVVRTLHFEYDDPMPGIHEAAPDAPHPRIAPCVVQIEHGDRVGHASCSFCLRPAL